MRKRSASIVLRESSTRNCHSEEVCHRRTARVAGSRDSMPCRPRHAGFGVSAYPAGAGGAASPPGVLTAVLEVTLTASASMRSISQSAGLVSGGSGTPAAASK